MPENKRTVKTGKAEEKINAVTIIGPAAPLNKGRLPAYEIGSNVVSDDEDPEFDPFSIGDDFRHGSSSGQQ